jgi:hypothetical protein
VIFGLGRKKRVRVFKIKLGLFEFLSTMSKVRLALEEKQQDLQLRHNGAFTKPEFKEMR